jgi:hypothetical protein
MVGITTFHPPYTSGAAGRGVGFRRGYPQDDAEGALCFGYFPLGKAKESNKPSGSPRPTYILLYPNRKLVEVLSNLPITVKRSQ